MENKSTIPVGFTLSVREKFGSKNIIFSSEFLRESKALYDNLYPFRNIVSTDMKDALMLVAHTFASLLQEGTNKKMWRRCLWDSLKQRQLSFLRIHIWPYAFRIL